VSAAIEFQTAVDEFNEKGSGEAQIAFRIGLHIGDVIIDGDDLYGDGVNVAARLEGEAPAGGVIVSGAVHDAVNGRLNAEFEDLGDLSLKNIERPIRAFRARWIAADWLAGARMPVARSPEIERQPLALAMPDKPSIAVLPFENISGDPEQDYFADGIVEDLITALSRFRWLLVIARNSTFTYKGRAVDVKQVSRDLGVRYVLEGSVRKAGNRLRITGQLVDGESASHLWADKYDGELEDVFELQDKVTRSVAAAIEPRVLSVEIARATRKSTSKLDAYDYCLRARPHVLRRTRAGLDEAASLLRAATDIDPDYAQAWAMSALCAANWFFLGHLDFQEVAPQAVWCARQAIGCDRDDAEVLAIAGYVLTWGGEHEEAAELVDRAAALNPHSSAVCTFGGWARIFGGRFDDAIALFQTALLLDPLSSNDASAFIGIAAGHFYLKRYNDAIAWARRGAAKNPELTSSLRYLAAALAHAGQVDEARRAINELLVRQPNSSLARSGSGKGLRYPWMLDHYLDGLRLAGLPE
jgi:TolB-like protein/Tfp pilus assembly protein PilF